MHATQKTPLASEYNEWHVLPIVTLTSIATIIGSGILALPVTLAETPLALFFLLFTLGLVAQVGVIYAVVELLQRASVAATPSVESSSTYGSATSVEQQPRPVSLFLVSRLYLPHPLLRILFFISTFFGLVALIVSYGLAGPQAVWQLASTGSSMSPPPMFLYILYWSLGTVGVIFFLGTLLTVFSSLTVLKGLLFVGVIGIVAALPAAARVTSIPSLFADLKGWNNAVTPFLVSCVALGGMANTLPVTFALLPNKPTHGQMVNFRRAVVAAVVICYLLNIGWVLAILTVVPRTAGPGEVSLAVANAEGQISTVPLIAALYAGNTVQGGLLNAIEITVELFIVVSTAVSFFVMSAGLRSFLDGAAANVSSSLTSLPPAARKWIPTATGYTISFGLILTLILRNPKGFISMLAGFSSIAINLQAGAMIFVALYFCRKISARAPSLPTVSPDSAQSSTGETALETKVTEDIALEMGSVSANAWIVFGTTFFTGACLLAAVGPFIGITVGGGD